MAACGSLGHLFQRPRPENPTLMESLSWSQINAATDDSSPAAAAPASFTEIFGELHFDERRSSACPPQPAPASDRCPPPGGDACGEEHDVRVSHPSSGSPMGEGGGGGEGESGTGEKGVVVPGMRRSESLGLCTEGLGSESSDGVEDPKAAGPGARQRRHSRALSASDHSRRRAVGDFPPPISSIGSGGRPWVSFRSYREGGRFVLREVNIPCQELLTASREGGRLKLRFVHRDQAAAAAEEEEDDDHDEAHEEGVEEEEEDGGWDG